MTGTGWRKLGPDPAIAAWAREAAAVAGREIAQSADAWRCGGTWFVGVDALPNGHDGAIGDVAFPWAALGLSPVPLHRAQLSVIRAGYPRPSAEESEAAYGFRLRRDAAHLDGLLPVGAARRRMIREPHGWILGLPLTGIRAAPLVVWEGSHRIIGQALRAALLPHPPETWADIDITDAYHAARAEVFATCARRELPVQIGEATLLHRLTLHGVAPWRDDEDSKGDRVIAYFRPILASVAEWIRAP